MARCSPHNHSSALKFKIVLATTKGDKTLVDFLGISMFIQTKLLNAQSITGASRWSIRWLWFEGVTIDVKTLHVVVNCFRTLH
jgi:hypothetical protein